jgi:hypothetical protein
MQTNIWSSVVGILFEIEAGCCQIIIVVVVTEMKFRRGRKGWNPPNSSNNNTAAGCSSRPSDMILWRLGQRTTSDCLGHPLPLDPTTPRLTGLIPRFQFPVPAQQSSSWKFLSSSPQYRHADLKDVLDRMHDNRPKVGLDEDNEVTRSMYGHASNAGPPYLH